MVLYLLEKDTQKKPLEKALKELGEKNYILIPLSGHIFRTLEPSEYEDGIKNWKEAYVNKKLPYVPKKWKYVLNTKDKRFAKRNKSKFEQLKKTIKEVDKIILAPDPDPEGASLAYEAVEYFNATDKIIGMLKTNDTTVSALKKEIKKLSIKNWKELVNAARGRQKGDWILGHNLTVASTVLLGNKVGGTVIVGPVKSVIMRIVVDRDEQFEKFKEIPYWLVNGKAKLKDNLFNVKFLYKNNENKWESKFEKEEEAKKLEKELKNTTGKVIELNKSNKKTKPPKPLSKTTLQKLANSLYGFSLKKISDIMQSLYEGKHGNVNEGYITYPRTDIEIYSLEEFDLFPNIINSLKGKKEYSSILSKLDTNNLLKRKEIYYDVNNEKDSDKVPPHFALRPTGRSDIEKLNKDELKIYNLILAYWVFQLYPDYEYENISGELSTIVDNVKATFNSNKTLKKGWKEVEEILLNKKVEQTHTIPENIQKGDEVTYKEITLERKTTKPKPRFTVGELASILGKVSNLFDDPEIKKQLKDVGIGTPATRDIHIENLIQKGFFKIEKKGKKEYIVSTPKTREIVKLLPEKLTSPILRAKMEEFIGKAQSGTIKEKEIVDFFINVTKDLIKEIEKISKDNNISIDKKEEDTGLKCPLCQGKIIETDRTFKCENNKWNPKTKKVEGCNFSILKNTKFYNIDKETLEKLLNNETIDIERGKLKLDLNNKYFISIDFNNNSTTSSKNNELIETKQTFKLGNKFVFKNVYGKKLTKKEAKQLLEGKEVKLTLTSKQKKKYKALCKLEDNGGIKILNIIK